MELGKRQAYDGLIMFQLQGIDDFQLVKDVPFIYLDNHDGYGFR